MLLGAGTDQLGIGRDDVGRNEIVDGQPKFACGPAKATAKRQASDAGRRINTERCGKPERLRFLVKVGQRGTRLDASRCGGRIDVHGFHQRQVDEQTPVAHGVPGDVVAAAAHGNEQFLVSRELDRIDHVGRT